MTLHNTKDTDDEDSNPTIGNKDTDSNENDNINIDSVNRDIDSN